MAEKVSAVEDCTATPLLKTAEFARRRVSVRYACPGIIHYISAAVTETAWAVNLSRSGIGLLLRRRLDCDAPLSVRVHGLKRGMSRKLIGRVAHCTPQGSGEWLVGCRFDVELSSQELLEVLQEISG
jgi:PilZ domain